MITIDELREIAAHKHVRFTGHAQTRMVERGIKQNDVINAINTGKIIEQYPDDYPFPSCLVLGLDIRNVYIHVVLAVRGIEIVIITVYRPTLEKWEIGYEKRRNLPW